jgi:hypothetical protein
MSGGRRTLGYQQPYSVSHILLEAPLSTAQEGAYTLRSRLRNGDDDSD